MRQEEGEVLSSHIDQDMKTSMLAEPSAQISDSPRSSRATPSGCARAHPHEPSKDKSPPSHINLDARPGTRSDQHGNRCPGKAKPQHSSPSCAGARGLLSGANITVSPKNVPQEADHILAPPKYAAWAS
jgi:hypothetical protein